jgi:hypothetical protein
VDDLTAFITARLDEDEVAAKRNLGGDGLGDRQGFAPSWPDYPTFDSPDLAAAQDYITRFRPARALREAAAKRAILAQRERSPAGSPVLTHALYCLAAIWSDHPDYRPEWKP